MSQEIEKLVLLGATGSIGESTLEVLRQHRDRMQIVAVACNTNFEKLLAIAREFNVPHVAIYDENAFSKAKNSPNLPSGTNLYTGMEGLLQLVDLPGVTHSLFAMVGVTGLRPALAAIEHGQKLVLANKEILVMAGELITRKARQNGASLIPADSEHNALQQCLLSGKPEEINRIILTSSGGSFRDTSTDEMSKITPDQALQHPNWDMGPKVTIDSSTMANKGLEIIEAHWLFDIKPEKIQVVVHPQSVVH
ncbi:MAG: 1-deoxy-D-xylulose-5-phosphate reductoisomerase [Opitutae bacterium]